MVKSTKGADLFAISGYKFDVVVGNPPYQKSGEHKNFAPALYHSFMEIAKKSAKAVSLIYPARWVAAGGGKGLKSFREQELKSNHYNKFFLFSKDLFFSNVSISGGINFFLWCKEPTKAVKLYRNSLTKYDYKPSVGNNGICNYFPALDGLFEKVKVFNSLSNIVYNRNYYGLQSNVLNTLQVNSDGLYTLYYQDNKNRAGQRVKINCPLNVNTADYKVFAVKTAKPFNGLAKLFVAKPFEICTETYLKIGSFTNEQEANNLYKYLSSQFVQTLVGIISPTHNHTRTNFRLVPNVDFTTGQIYDKPNEYLDFSKDLDLQLRKIYHIDNMEWNVYIEGLKNVS